MGFRVTQEAESD